MSEQKFYKCNHCGNVLLPAFDAGVTPSCCGEKMQILEPNSTEAAVEKHMPVVEKEADGHHVNIDVGAVEHPMTDEHYIQFIALFEGDKVRFVKLKPGDKPFLRLSIKDNTQLCAVYEYCNLHGLWKIEC